jgi:hypothetical protein
MPFKISNSVPSNGLMDVEPDIRKAGFDPNDNFAVDVEGLLYCPQGY